MFRLERVLVAVVLLVTIVTTITIVALVTIVTTVAVAPPALAGPAAALEARMPEPGAPAETLGSRESPESHPGNRITTGPARDPDLDAGWPVDLGSPGAGFPYTPTLFDIDLDGADEIFLTGGHTFALRGDGSFLPGWPTTEMLYMGYGTNANKPGPSTADLDRDGNIDVLWTERDWWAGSARMWCFNGKNADGSDLPGFPQQAPGEPSNALDTPFVLGDTDGDGDLEAWGAHTLGNAFIHYRVSAFDHLGSRLFTVDLDLDENVLGLYFGDLDGDGSEEMFAVSSRSPSLRLHVFEADGSAAPGYPITLLTTSETLPFGPPIPADLDADGDLEILIGLWSGSGSRAYCHHHDGSPCPGYPLQIATSSQLLYLGLGDVTGDGEPELLAFDNHLGGDHRVHVMGLPSGAPLPGWPRNVIGWPKGFPTIVDVDNDGVQDVCLATDTGELLAISGDGQTIAGYPKQMLTASISGVAAGDIDGDGLFELVAATWDGWVYAWDTTGEALPGRADWPMRGIDARNTGVYRAGGTTTAVLPEPLSPLAYLRARPNPVFGRAELLFDTAPEPTTVDIYDASGHLVESLDVGNGYRAAWRPARSQPSGIYFARIRGQAAVSPPVKLVVIR